MLQPSPRSNVIADDYDVPIDMPTCQLPANYKQRHGLHAVNKYKARCTNPIHQADRCPHSSCSWENSEKHMFLCLGHCTTQLPSLSSSVSAHNAAFLSTPFICHDVSFHIAARHCHLTIRNFLACANRVLRRWQTKLGGKR